MTYIVIGNQSRQKPEKHINSKFNILIRIEISYIKVIYGIFFLYIKNDRFKKKNVIHWQLSKFKK